MSTNSSEYNCAFKKRRYAKRKLDGLCVHCPNKARENKTTCQQCMDRHVTKTRARRRDSKWQNERPEPGSWWVAIAPDKRDLLSFWSGTKPIKDVWVAKSGEVFQGNMHLSDELLTGAKWQRRTVPADPFAGGGE